MRWTVLLASCALVACAGESAAGSRGDGRIAYLARSGMYWQVWTANPDGGDARQITDSPYEKARCSWFPDGRELLVNSLDGRAFRVDVESGAESPLDLPLGGFTDAALSPDGQRIAFPLSTAGGIDANEIWTVDLDGSDLRRLTRMKWLQHDPAWSPDGEWIYFLSSNGDQEDDIWRISVDGKRREQLTVASLFHFEVAVSRDLSLAFSSNRTGNYEIYTLEPGGMAQQWTHHPALDGHPTWSPDGKTLIFHSTRSGTLNLWRIAAPGKDPEQITDHAGGARGPVWWHPPDSPS